MEVTPIDSDHTCNQGGLATYSPLDGPGRTLHVASYMHLPPPRGRTGQALDKMALGREAGVKR